MDGVSVAASIAGLVSLADTVFTRTYRYAKAVKHATKEVTELATEVRNLCSLLHGLRLVLHGLEEEEQEHASNLLNLADFRLHHVNSCLTTLTNIQKKLDKYHRDENNHKLIKQSLRNLIWPLSASDTKELLAEVEKHKATITIALAGDTLATVLKALSRQEDLAAELKTLKNKQNERWAMDDQIRMDKERKDILDFFGKVDPSSNHKMSLKLRHPLTGLWVTEGLPFRTWLLSKNAKLWLSGIPGAGKTVIAASVIEETMKEGSQDRAVAYFYCDYKDVEKQKPVNILGSLASQLARQNENAFSQLEELYHTCHPKGKASMSSSVIPEPDVLACKIREMASKFDDVSVIVDGLDECGADTSEVVELLIGLASEQNSNTRALFLSRNEYEIRELLQEDYIHLEIAAHSEDLRLYVAAEMETRRYKHGRQRLRINSSELKELTMKTLVEQADGMFRWVTCQLDYLCGLPNDEEKRKALGSLPPGLNTTYEQILDRVNQNPESIRRMVQNTLQWVVSPLDGIRTAALLHATSIKDGDRSLNPESFYDEEDILMHCSSFIRQSTNGDKLEMAHFTVKEFLCALDPDGHSPYSRYSQMESFVYPQLAITCLTYITLDCFNGKVVEDLDLLREQNDNTYPFRVHAVAHWANYAQKSWTNSRILELARNLFDPSTTGCFLSWARDFFYYDQWRFYNQRKIVLGNFPSYFYAGGLKPLHMAAALGLPEICSWLIASGCDVNKKSNVGTPLHCVLLGSYQLVSMFLSEDWFSITKPFEYVTENPGSLQALKILIANGADYNASYRDRYGKEISSNYLAFYSGTGRGAEHPLVQLIAAGSQLETQLLQHILDDVWHRVIKEKEFIGALVIKLKETNPDLSTNLQAALKLNSSSGLDVVKLDSKILADVGDGDLVDLFRSAVRFDQTQRMKELIRDGRLDIARKYGEDSSTFLHDAAESGSIGAVRLLLSLGANVNESDKYGRTALHGALIYADEGARQQQCISLLLDQNLKIDAIDHDGRTAWHAAARLGDRATMSFLLACCEQEAKGVEIADKDGLTPLFTAARNGDSQICELLLSHASYLPQRCPEGLSLVHYAIKMNSINILQMLQAKGFALTEKTEDGRSGFHFLTGGITRDIVQLLIDSGVDATSPDLNGETPLHVLACLPTKLSEGVSELLFDLLATGEPINMSTSKGFTPLHYSLHPPNHMRLHHGHDPYTKHAESLIARGANVHIRLPDGRSCLTDLVTKYEHFSTDTNQELEKLRKSYNYDEIHVKKRSLNERFVRMQALSKVIISSTTDLEMLTELIDGYQAGQTQIRPLNWYISISDAELVGLLLDKGVDVDLCNIGPGSEGSWSALNSACWYPCSLEIFRRILNKSARLQEHDKDGLYLSHIACRTESCASPFVLDELCKAGLDPNLPAANSTMETALMEAAKSGKEDHVQMLFDHRVNARMKNSAGTEAVHFVAVSGHTAVLEKFLHLDIDWNRCLNGYGNTILQIAALNGRDDVVNFVIQRSLLDDLDRQIPDHSALALAVHKGHSTTARILLKAGANVNIIGASGKLPIHLAAETGRVHVIRELFDYNCSLVPDNFGMTPQLIALKYGHQEAFVELNKYAEDKGETPLTGLGRLKAGDDDFNIQDEDLKLRAKGINAKASGELENAIKRGDFQLCKALVEAGCSIDNFHCGCTPLLSALDRDCDEITQYLLKKGVSFKGLKCSHCNTEGYSAVHLACIQEDKVEILRLILARDPVVVSLAFQSPVSPLHVAVACENIVAVEILLHYWKDQIMGDFLASFDTSTVTTSITGSAESRPDDSHADLKQQNARLLSIYDAQIKASKLDSVWLLSEANNLDTDEFETGTALHLAVYRGNIEMTKLLLRYGASIDSIDDDGYTPLLLACYTGSMPIIHFLLDSGANPFNRSYFGQTPAMIAAQRDDMEVLGFLLNFQTNLTLVNNYGWNLLHYAADEGGPKAFAYLFIRGCCCYTESYRAETPVKIALHNHGEFPAFRSLLFNLGLDFYRLRGIISHTKHVWESHDKTMIKFFLKRAPPDVACQEMDATTWRNGSVLGDAVLDGQQGFVELFVQAGANMELDRGSYGTPLLAACALGRLQIVKYLIRAGAKIISTKEGRICSAVEAAQSFPDIIQWLLVDRHVEQSKIGLVSDCVEDQEVCTWSGLQCVKVETAGLYSKIHDGSMFDHAKELAKLRRRLQGVVVYVFSDSGD